MTLPESRIRVKPESATDTPEPRRLRKELRAIAAELGTLLAAARVHLATFRPARCRDCGDLFQPAGRVSGRCMDCAWDAREVGQ